MKYLELTDLDILSNSLSFTSNESKVRTRSEYLIRFPIFLIKRASTPQSKPTVVSK